MSVIERIHLRRKPAFTLPLKSCDAHCHVFGPASRFPYAPNRRYTPEDAPKEALAALHSHLGIERAVIPWCEQHGVAVVGYSPFGHGGFPKPSSKGGRLLGEIATARDATPRQVALAFLVRRPSLFAIPKAADTGHVEENAKAAQLTLTAAEIARIDAAFPAGSPRGLAMI